MTKWLNSEWHHEWCHHLGYHQILAFIVHITAETGGRGLN